MTRLASRSPAAPFSTSRPAPVIPSHQQAKDRQDEARRQQQVDEKIRELQRMLKEARQRRDGLREAIANAIFAFDHGRTQDAIDELRDALDGGGDDHANG